MVPLKTGLFCFRPSFRVSFAGSALIISYIVRLRRIRVLASMSNRICRPTVRNYLLFQPNCHSYIVHSAEVSYRSHAKNMGQRPICYLDNNATTRVAPEVADAMLPFLREFWGNPSSAYHFGHQLAKHLEDARAKVAALINAD